MSTSMGPRRAAGRSSCDMVVPFEGVETLRTSFEIFMMCNLITESTLSPTSAVQDVGQSVVVAGSKVLA